MWLSCSVTLPYQPPRGDSAMCCGFGAETLARTKNSCDTVVAEFFEVYEARYRDAFCPKARSHRAITTLIERR